MQLRDRMFCRRDTLAKDRVLQRRDSAHPLGRLPPVLPLFRCEENHRVADHVLATSFPLKIQNRIMTVHPRRVPYFLPVESLTHIVGLKALESRPKKREGNHAGGFCVPVHAVSIPRACGRCLVRNSDLPINKPSSSRVREKGMCSLQVYGETQYTVSHRACWRALFAIRYFLTAPPISRACGRYKLLTSSLLLVLAHDPDTLKTVRIAVLFGKDSPIRRPLHKILTFRPMPF